MISRDISIRFTVWLGRHGVETRFWRELESTGAKTQLTRRVPIAALLDDTGAWLISQHGYRSGWAHNIAANPVVRLRAKGEWLSGTAAFRPDLNPAEIARRFAPHPALSPIIAAGFRALQTDPIVVRIDFA